MAFRRTVLIFIAAALAVAAVLAYRLHATHSFFEQHSLLSRFPAEDAAVLSIDFTALRSAGLLTASKAPPEPDYKRFVDATGFDYKRDLDSVAATFSDSGNFYIARGRFDWTKLRAYAARSGGACYQQLCRMPGSTPERHISFLPLRNDAIALAVSTNDLAATRLANPSAPLTAALPSAPVWFSIPGSQLRRQNTLPPGLHLILSALASSDRVLITVAPDSGGPHSNGIEAHFRDLQNRRRRSPSRQPASHRNRESEELARPTKNKQRRTKSSLRCRKAVSIKAAARSRAPGRSARL